ncbi:Tubulin glycylase 3B [Hondaea fermentalgiana]|uniref:Tubulin glycylase 3B n=1 Tax=Hondaea fermentalgiana TaxID=2315210 RepID=A0A2R5G8T0_9STRA|nr:Tubulin glycylase 3B [Hondaea fermentalgiana]|eukprot:GBG26739.1 Tubulin glycylase 3B [Hondaea fermentalgiana]
MQTPRTESGGDSARSGPTRAELRQAELLKKLQQEREDREAERARALVLEEKRKLRIKEQALGQGHNEISSRLLLPKRKSNRLRPEDLRAEEDKLRVQQDLKLQRIVQRVQSQGPDPRHADFLRRLSDKKRAEEKAGEDEALRQRDRRAAVAEAARRVGQRVYETDLRAGPETDESKLEEDREGKSNHDVSNDSNDEESKEADDTTLVPSVYTKHRRAVENDFELERSFDRERWAQKHGIDVKTPIFICAEGYPAVRDELVRRGWFENPDKESTIWDFQFARTVTAFDKRGLREDQIINRFYGTGEMCSKAGIAKNLQDLHWFDNADPNVFFPRCYNLGNSDKAELDDFVEDFKVTAAERVLKLLQAKVRNAKKLDQTNIVTVSPFLVRTAMRVANKFANRYNDDYVDAPVGFVPPVVSPIDWAVLMHAQDDLNLKHTFLAGALQYARSDNLDQLMEHCIAEQEHDRFWGPQADLVNEEETKFEDDPRIDVLAPRSKAMRKYVRHQLRKLAEAARDGSLDTQDVRIDETDGVVQRCTETLAQLMEFRGDQGRINGADGRNVWIVKPAGKSRGRGIQCFDNLEQLFRYTRANTQETTKWVVQKYMENSLIVHRRKFDIRQWVLVTSWNPLTIFFYDDCYFRFCVGEYSLQDLEDKFIHLANNSISKHSENFYNGPVAENMWRRDEFLEHLDKVKGRPGVGAAAWADHIRPAMETIVRASMSCVQDLVRSRANSFEIFGFDFMLDDQLNPWLIEINSSPSMEYSTAITKALASDALRTSVACVLDFKYRIDADGRRRLRTKPATDVDTGLWKLLHASPNEFRRKLEGAADLVLTGSGIKSYNKSLRPKKFYVRRRKPRTTKPALKPAVQLQEAQIDL